MLATGFVVKVQYTKVKPDYLPFGKMGYDALLGTKVIQTVEACDIELNYPDCGPFPEHTSPPRANGGCTIHSTGSSKKSNP